MALSGSLTTSSITRYGITTSFTINWTATQDIANNKSTISWTVTTNQSPDGSGYVRGLYYIKAVVNNNTVIEKQNSISGNNIISVSNGTEVTPLNSSSVASSNQQYLKISHNNSTGEASFTLSFEVGVGTQTANVSGTKSFTLNTIPRATTSWTIADNSIYTYETTSGTIGSRANDNFRHSIKLTINNNTAELWSEGRGTGNKETSFITDSIPDTLKSVIKSYYSTNNVTTVTGTLTLETYSSNSFSTLIGSNSKSFTVNLREPTFELKDSSGNTISGSVLDTSSIKLNYNIYDSYFMFDKIIVNRSAKSTDNTVNYGTVTSNTYTSLNGSSGTITLNNADFERVMTTKTSANVVVSISSYYSSTKFFAWGGSSVSAATYSVSINTSYHKYTITCKTPTTTNLKGDNKVLAGYSGVTFEFVVSSTTSATISDTSFTNRGTGPNGTISGTKVIYNPTPSNSTNYTLRYRYTITDSRGTAYTSEDSQSVSVIGYTAPTISSASAKRTFSTSGTPVEDPKGTNVYFSVNWAKGTNTNTSTANSATLTIKYGNTSIGTTTSAGNYTVYATGNNYTDTNSYTFNITATDNTYGITATTTVSISKFIIPISLHPNGGVGLGGLAEANKIGIYLNDAWYITKTRNNVLAAPNGSNGNPSWRRLVAADISSGTFSADRIPSLNASKIGSGTLGVARGGTGNTTGTATYATTTDDTNNALYLVGVTSGATTTLKRDTAFTVTGKVFDGEIHFKNSSYAPEIKDTAPNIGCANKGSRYLVNELLVDGIVAPPTAYSEHSMSTRASTIQFYKYTAASGQWTDLTKIAVINADGFYRPQGTTFTGTYSLGGLAGVARSSTILRTQLPLPYNFLNFSGTSVSGSSASFVSDSAGTGMGMKLKMGYYGASGTQEFTVSSVAVGDINPGSVMINITFSTALQPGRPYVIENGKISLSMKAKA